MIGACTTCPNAWRWAPARASPTGCCSPTPWRCSERSRTRVSTWPMPILPSPPDRCAGAPRRRAPLRRHARGSRRLPRLARAPSRGAASRACAHGVALPAPRSPHERARPHRARRRVRARRLSQRDRLALRPRRPRPGQCVRAQARRAALLRARAAQHVPSPARRAHAGHGRQVRAQRRARPLPERARQALLPQGRKAVRLRLGHPEHRARRPPSARAIPRRSRSRCSSA